MLLYLLAPFALQAFLMGVDEFLLHRRRGLGWWERIGHPLDTLSVVVCLVIAAFLPYTESNALVFAFAALVSCLLVTKDEWVHAKECSGFENWLHALLFMIHPLGLASAFVLWLFRVELLAATPEGHLVLSTALAFPAPPSELEARLSLYGVTAATAFFLIYQIRSMGHGAGSSKGSLPRVSDERSLYDGEKALRFEEQTVSDVTPWAAHSQSVMKTEELSHNLDRGASRGKNEGQPGEDLP